MYSAQLLDHFQNPRNAGVVESPSAEARVENPVCGDILQLSLKVETGVITQARFRCKGCVAAMACSSLLTEMLTGMSVAKASHLKREELVAKIGGLRPESLHASHLAMDALAAVLKRLDQA
ncbi:MAG: iron-sulfur cluster assembly scaffold protein [Candidatus Acidiferrum sp.]